MPREACQRQVLEGYFSQLSGSSFVVAHARESLYSTSQETVVSYPLTYVVLTCEFFGEGDRNLGASITACFVLMGPGGINASGVVPASNLAILVDSSAKRAVCCGESDSALRPPS